MRRLSAPASAPGAIVTRIPEYPSRRVSSWMSVTSAQISLSKDVPPESKMPTTVQRLRPNSICRPSPAW